MAKREAPLDTIMANNTIVNNYTDYYKTESFLLTVNVSPKKYISNKPYAKYSAVEQEILLLKTLYLCTELHPMLDLKYNFELTKQGQKHLHASFYSTIEHAEDIQMAFHKKFGMPNLDPSICANLTKTIVSKSHADEYALKEVKPEECDVPNYNMFLQYH